MKLYSYNKSFNNFIVTRAFQEEKVHKFCLVNNGNWICTEPLTSDVTRVSVQNARFPIGFSELACIFSGDQLNYPTGDRISLSCKWFLRNHESDPDVPVLYADLCAVHVHGKKIPECPRVPRSFLGVFQFSASLLATFLFLLPLAS